MISLSFSIYDLEYYLLILTRVSCFIFVAPFFSMNNTPARVRIGLSIFVSYLLYQILTPAVGVPYTTLLEYAMVVIKEAMTGLIIGFGATMCTAIVSFAGSIADMETGLSMVTLFDPATKEQVSITGGLYQYVIMMLLITTGMYRYLLGALADSFVLIPVNGQIFFGKLLLNAALRFLTDFIIIAFRICLPIFCVILLLNAVLGILARVSPQMNMFAVGIQLKILVGLSILLVTMAMMGDAANFIFIEMKKVIIDFVGGIA